MTNVRTFINNLWVDNIPKQGFARKLKTLLSGTLSAQAIQFSVLPLLTRLYTTDEFGVFAIAQSVFVMVGTLACLGYDMAIFVPKSETEPRDLLAGMTYIIPFTTVVLMTPAIIFLPMVDRFETLSNIPNVFLLLSAGSVAGAWSAAFYSMALRNQKIRLVSISRVVQTSTWLSIALLMGYFSQWGSLGLIMGFVIGVFAQALTLSLYDKTIISSLSPFSFERIKNIGKTMLVHRRFPIFIFWVGFFRHVVRLAPTVLLAYFYPMKIAGLYFIAHRLLQAPVQLLGNPLKKIYIQHIAEKIRSGNKITSTHFKLVITLALLWIPVLLVIYVIISEDLLVFILGPELGGLKSFLQILAPMYAIRFLMNPIAAVLAIMGFQNWQLFYQFLLCVMGVSVLIYGGNHLALEDTLLLYSVSSTLLLLMIVGLSFLGSLINDRTLVGKRNDGHHESRQQ